MAESRVRERMSVAFLAGSTPTGAPVDHGLRRNGLAIHAPRLQQTSHATTPSTASSTSPGCYNDSLQLAPLRSSFDAYPPSRTDAHRQRPPHSSPGSSVDSADDAELGLSAARPARPAYNSEQKFFIMYARIVLGMSWPDIGAEFSRQFGEMSRTRGGLTAVYYRVRKQWGMQEVLKTDPGITMEDRRAVHERALWMPAEFLGRIGYRYVPV